jgi:hypothetical protein
MVVCFAQILDAKDRERYVSFSRDTHAFSSKEDGRGALLGGPMPAIVVAEVAEVSRAVMVRIGKIYNATSVSQANLQLQMTT